MQPKRYYSVKALRLYTNSIGLTFAQAAVYSELLRHSIGIAQNRTTGVFYNFVHGDNVDVTKRLHTRTGKGLCDAGIFDQRDVNNYTIYTLKPGARPQG